VRTIDTALNEQYTTHVVEHVIISGWKNQRKY